MRVGRGQPLRIVVSRVGGRSFGVFNQRPLQLVGNDAQFVSAHLQQRIHAGLNADGIGRGDELPVSGQPHLAGVGDDPLRVGSGQIVAEQQRPRSQPRGICELARGIFRAQLSGAPTLSQLEGPLRTLGQQAPVVGGADRIEQIEVRAGVDAEIDSPMAVVAAGNHRGNPHVKVGVGLILRCHAGKAIHQPWDYELARAIDDARALGDGDGSTVAHIRNAPVTHNDDRIREVSCRTAPVADVYHRAANQHQRRRAQPFRRNRGRCLRPGKNRCQGRPTQSRQRATKNSHKKAGLFRIVAQWFSESHQTRGPPSVWEQRRGAASTARSQSPQPWIALSSGCGRSLAPLSTSKNALHRANWRGERVLL